MSNQTVLEVEGMTCGSCVRHVRGALADVRGVAAVDVRLDDGVAIVSHDGTAAVEDMTAAVRAAGYAVRAGGRGGR